MNYNGGTSSCGSPIPKRSVPPQVSFIIDLDLIKNQGYSLDEVQARVQCILLKILLFFYNYVDNKVIWGYQLLEIHSASALGMNDAFTQNGEQFSLPALNRFKRRLKKALQSVERDKKIRTCAAYTDHHSASKIVKIGLVLRNSMSSFRWTWAWCPGAQTSPLRPTAVSSRVENYLFIISNLPRCENEIIDYFQIPSTGNLHDGKAAELESLAVGTFYKEIVHKDMWKWFRDQRISVNIIDDLYDMSSRSHPWSSTFYPCLSSLFKVYSGRIIPSRLFLDHTCPLPFSELFNLSVERYTNYNMIFDRFFGSSILKTPLKMVTSIADTGRFYYIYEMGRICGSRRRTSGSKLPLNLVPHQASNVRFSLFNVDYKNYQIYFYVSRNLKGRFCNEKRKRLKIEPLGYCSNVALIGKNILESGILLLTPDFCHMKSARDGFAALDSLIIALGAQKKCLVVKIEVFKSVADLEPRTESQKKLDIVHRLAVVSPFIPGALMLKFVDDGKVIQIMDILDRIVDAITIDTKEKIDVPSSVSPSCDSCSASSNKYLDMWFSLNIPKDVQDYVFSDYLPEDNFSYFEDATLGVLSYSYKRSKYLHLAAKSTHTNDVRNAGSPVDRCTNKRLKQKENTAPTDFYSNISTFEELFQTFHTAYVDIVYDTSKSILEFLECLLPSLYSVLEKVSDKLHGSKTPVGYLFDYITTYVIYSVSQLEHKYREIPKVFGEILNTPDGEAFDMGSVTISKLEMGNLKNWLSGALNEIDIPGASPKSKALLNPRISMSKVRERITELRIQEAKLQVVMLLECIRLSIETSTPLPELPTKPSRLCELMRPEPFSLYGQVEFHNISAPSSDNMDANLQTRKVYLRALESLTDRLCIWYSVAGLELDSGGNRLLKTFVEPIIEEFYQFSLTEIVKLLHLKAGGNAFKEGKNKSAHQAHMFIEGKKHKQRRPSIYKRQEADGVGGSPTPLSRPLKRSEALKNTRLTSKSLEHLNRRQVVMHNKVSKQKPPSGGDPRLISAMSNGKRFKHEKVVKQSPRLHTGAKFVNSYKKGVIANSNADSAKTLLGINQYPEQTDCITVGSRHMNENCSTSKNAPVPSEHGIDRTDSIKRREKINEESHDVPNTLEFTTIKGNTVDNLSKDARSPSVAVNYLLHNVKDLDTNALLDSHPSPTAELHTTVAQDKCPATIISVKSHIEATIDRDHVLSVKSVNISTDPPKEVLRENIFPEKDSPAADGETPHSHVTISATPGSQRRLHGLLQGFAEDLDYWEDLEFT